MPEWMEQIGMVLVWYALGCVLLLAELLLLSFGLLGLAAALCFGLAIWTAFEIGLVTGMVAAVVAPLTALLAVRWGLRRLSASKLVVQSEMSGDAGYHHHAERLGVAVGGVGTLVTHARPTGRARFAGGELDVQVRGRTADRGSQVQVVAIEGPIIFVIPYVQPAGQSAVKESSHA